MFSARLIIAIVQQKWGVESVHRKGTEMLWAHNKFYWIGKQVCFLHPYDISVVITMTS